MAVFPTVVLILAAATLAGMAVACAPVNRDDAPAHGGVGYPATVSSDADRVALLRAAVAALAARSEHRSDTATVDHILIMVDDERSEAQAEELAADVMHRPLFGGESWDELKSTYSGDPPPGGPYPMHLSHVTSPPSPSYPRAGMVPGFGFAAWRLQVGETGIVPHDLDASPYGFHIVRRVQ